MAIASSQPLAHYVRRLAATHASAGLSDAHLLRRFAEHRDESAFAALVARHGPMVLGVCRRLLGHEHDAEDAFQLTFVALSRKAGCLRRPEALGPWLHGVACRTARKLRGRAARRRACERQAAPPTSAPADDLLWRDLRPVLDEAVAALPGKYREPVVLCYLGGATVGEAARRLGCPRGTIATRLAWARARLRARLARRGVTLSAAALAAALASAAARACPAVPAALVRAGQVPFAPSQGGGKLMLLPKGKVAVLLLTLGLGAAVLGGRRSPPLTPTVARAASPGPTVKETAPPGEVEVLFLGGSTRFLLEDYRQAEQSFRRLGRRHPDSPLAPTAAALAVLARQLGTSPADSDRKAEGRRLIKAALDGPRAAAAPQAEKDFKTAEFYCWTGHFASARFYYELVCRRYPRTMLARKAAQRLRELREMPREAAAEKDSPTRVLARVNGTPILAAEVYAAAYLAIPEAGDLAAAALARRIGAIRKETLDRLVEREMVWQHAEALLKTRNPRALERLQDVAAREFYRRWVQPARRNGDLAEEELQASLRIRGTTLEAVGSAWQRDFLVEEYLRSRVSRASDPSQEKKRLVADLKRKALIEYVGGR
jgi:RNA polymerase sigma factor (sigma-70 family)